MIDNVQSTSGLLPDGVILLADYAEMLKVEYNLLKKQARKARALINIAGVFYVDVPKFIKARQTAQENAAASRQNRVAERRSQKANEKARVPETVETTENIGLLRGQQTRLTNLITKAEDKVRKNDLRLRGEKDTSIRSNLNTDNGALSGSIASNKVTLAKVEKRLRELEGPTGPEDSLSATV